jgi:hypothetical protein
LLLVDYDLGELDLLNRAQDRKQDIELRVHRQQGASPVSITNAQLWASFDDGASWRPVALDSQGGGRFTATIRHPANPAQPYVSLRVLASDAGGSSISQTIIRAYGLLP